MEFLKYKNSITIVIIGGLFLIFAGGIASRERMKEKEEDVPVKVAVNEIVKTEAEDSAPLGHDMKLAVWETATCLKGGFYNNVCQRCGIVENITEEPLPHDVEDVLVQEGNCMEDTIIKHICKSCGQQVEEDIRYTPQIHHWIQEEIDNSIVLYCQWCGVGQ